MRINTNLWNKIRYTFYTPVYDWIASVFKSYRKQSIDALNIEPDDKVLILGAGTGLDLEFLTHQQQVYAIDITPSMINSLKQRAKHLGINVDAKVMDGGSLTFDDNYFDAIILHLIVAVIPEPISCLKEVERVLKPDGKFTIMDKFATSGHKPNLFRRFINLFSNFLATNINRDIDELLSHTNLVKKNDIPLKSIFRLIQGSK